MRFSFSNNKTVVASGLAVLVSNEPVSAFCESLSLDVQKSAQVFKKPHLVAVVLCVILNVPLVGSKVLDNVFLLSKLKNGYYKSLRNLPSR